MKKKILFVLMVITITILLFGAMSVSAETSGYYTYTVSNGEATITDCDTSISGEIVIPDGLDGYPVTSIGVSAFSGCAGLTNVTIGKRITKIYSYAFQNCIGLTSVTIGKNVTSIGEGAFKGCISLVEMTIPKAIYGNFEASRFGYIFGYTENSSQTTIDGATYQAKFNNYCYYYIPASLKKVTITSGEITTSAFYNCNNIDEIILGNGVTKIGEKAFQDCKGLTSILISDNVTNIGNSAFENCIGLKNVTIPDSVTSIGDYAFHNSTGLTSITISDNVKSIGSSAFKNCIGLTSITVPDSVTNIGGAAFQGCNSLVELTMPKATYGTKEASRFGYIFGYKSTYTSSAIEGATYQGYFSYYYHYYIPPTLKRVTITSGEITESAFYNCDNIEEIVLNNGVTNIANSAFKRCIGLKTITIPNSVMSIDDEAFWYSDSLTNITIGNSVISIGEEAFRGCDSLKTVYYNGTEEEWDYIKIGRINDALENATIHYFAYITFIEENGNKVKKTMQDRERTIDITSIEVPKNYRLTLYTDSEMAQKYDLSKEISGDLILYIKLEKIGTSTACVTSTKGEKIFIISPSGLPDNSQIILACYNDNKLADIQSITNINEKVYFVVSIPFDSAKVMVWEDLENMTPVCEVEIVK